MYMNFWTCYQILIVNISELCPLFANLLVVRMLEYVSILHKPIAQKLLKIKYKSLFSLY